MQMTAGELADFLGGEMIGDPKTPIARLDTLEQAEEASISFLANPKYERFIYETKASAVLVDRQFSPKKKTPSLIRVDDPYISFTALLEDYSRRIHQEKVGKEEPVFIGQNENIGKEVYLGAFSYIGQNVTLGDHVKIFPHCYIGDNSVIGDHSILFPGVKLYDRSIVGRFCKIQSGAVIGAHGFGFAPKKDGSYRSIPQVGNVKLEDHVEIGANTTIDCATIGTTLIQQGVKIDNLVQIAHNAAIGEHTVIAAQTGISGSTKVGKNVTIGGQVGTVGHITIADKTIVGARSGVTKNTQSGDILFGVPAMDHRSYMKSYAIFKQLPEVLKQIEVLEQKTLNLSPRNSHE